jgi:outer membrane protein TolC
MLTLLGGCSMAPAYHPPVMPAPVAFKELPTAGDPVWKPVDAAAAVPPAAWWEGFGDPLLDQLELLIDRGAGALRHGPRDPGRRTFGAVPPRRADAQPDP